MNRFPFVRQPGGDLLIEAETHELNKGMTDGFVITNSIAS